VPTARELLEQVDALMRRNRALEAADAVRAPAAAAGAPPVDSAVPPPAVDDVPLLTEAVAPPVFDEVPVLTEAVSPPAVDDVPMLSEAVAPPVFDEAPMPAEAVAPPVFDEAPMLSEAVAPRDVAEPVAEPLPAVDEVLPVLAEATPSPPLDVPVLPPVAGQGELPEDVDARWRMVAADIEMQILQRLDIFTDTGLQEQLAARLQPIVDRASADLVATINRQVGQLLRSYVAEAVEREIDQWRHGGG
jgi:hypothetical protein